MMQLPKGDHWVTEITEWEEAADPNASRMYHLVYDSTQRGGIREWVVEVLTWWEEMLEECLKRLGRMEGVKHERISVNGPKQRMGSNNCGPMAYEFAMQAFKCPRNVTVGRRQNKLGVWLQMLEYGTDKGKPAWDGGDTSRKRMGQLMKSEIEVQREQWHKEHYNCPVPLDLQDEKKGKDKKVSPEEVRRVLEENSKRKKDDQPYGRRGRKQDLSDVLSKKVNPNLLNGVELRAYEKKYKEIQQDDIKHLARCGYLPVAACINKWVKSKFDIVTPPELCSGPIQDI